MSLYSDTLKYFVGETLNMGVLDSGCTSNVCGKAWLECYLDTLDPDILEQIEQIDSSKEYKFGSGESFKSIKKVKIPSILGGIKVNIETDVVDCEIPLLISKDAMKKAKMNIDFVQDEVEIFGKKEKLQFTTTGHYCIPIGLHTSTFKEERESQIPNKHILLFVKDWAQKEKSDKIKNIEKLHRQFSHASVTKLKALLSDAGIKDKETSILLESVVNSCAICLRYKKAPPRPVVGLSLAHVFNETVAMDLKQWADSPNKIWFLHLVDHATRYSASCIIKSKRKEVIVECLFKIWIKIFGAPQKFLVDNGGEFHNEEFRDFCENLNVKIKTTAAESPWSNGLIERHNGILGESVTKIINDTNCSLEIALAWAVSAKNALHNVHGFSPNQLVFGRNPNYPSVLIDKPPALEGRTTSEIVSENLNAMHHARKAFIEMEASEKIRRALRHNIRGSGGVKYFTGDSVFYKRNKSNEWRGPGTVIGQDGQEVLVKHGSMYVRVHPCRLNLDSSKDLPFEYQNNENNSNSLNDSNNILDDNGSHNYTYADNEEDITDTNDNRPSVINDNIIDESNISEINSMERSNQQERNKNENLQNSALVRPKVKQKVRYVPITGGPACTVTIISKGGKNSGKYSNWLNVCDDNGEIYSIDWSSQVKEWSVIENDINVRDKDYLTNINEGQDFDTADDEEYILFNVNKIDKQIITVAQNNEFTNWKNNDVYIEIPFTGQKCISTRWVYSEKYVDGKRQIKARLVARGFEETQITETDSPTCSKECIRLIFSILISNGWHCSSIDIKSAFLQGKEIEREVYVYPPKEAKSENIWKLKKCVYGLNDASRTWYLRVRDEMLKLKVEPSKYEPALFYWRFENRLQGLIGIHVDDFCWGGTKLFEEKVICPLKEIFDIGKESTKTFKYLGLNVEQQLDCIIINQNEYIESVEPICINKERSKQIHYPVNEEELKKLRALVGQLNWIAMQTRPDILFDCCDIAGSFKNATVESMLKANKVVKKLKDENYIKFKMLQPEEFKLIVYHDASYANLKDGGSQGGYIILLTDIKEKNILPIAWQSKRLRRVVRSTLAAETLSMVDAVDAAFWLSCILNEILGKGDHNIECRTDSQSLLNAVYSMTSVLEKRLRVDIAILKEMISKHEIQKIEWVSGSQQIADCLTKKGCSPTNILSIIRNNEL